MTGLGDRTADRYLVKAVTDIAYGRLINATDIAVTRGSRKRKIATTFRMIIESHKNDLIVTNESTRSPIGLVLLSLYLTITRQRKLVLTEFLPGVRNGASGMLLTAAYRLFLGTSLAGVQVMTSWERDDYIRRYRLSPSTVHHIPFYEFDDTSSPVAVDRVPGTVMSSGRNSCDWDTFLDAAEKLAGTAEFTIVCPISDRDRVAERARTLGVQVLVDVPRAQHDEMLATTAVFALVLKDSPMSAGHVRLMSAATRSTPVVATAVRGMKGYESLAVSTVRPGSPDELAAAIARMIADPDSQYQKAAEINEQARRRPKSKYESELISFFEDSVIR